MVSKENKTEVELESVLNYFVKLRPENSNDLGNKLDKTGMLAKIMDLSERGDIADALYKIISKRPEFAAFVGALKSPTAYLSSEDGKLSVIRLFFHFEASKNEKLAKELHDYLETNFVRDGKLDKRRLLVGLLVYYRRTKYPESRLLWDEKEKKPYFYVKEVYEKKAEEEKPLTSMTPVKTGDLATTALSAFDKGDKATFNSAVQKASNETLEKIFWEIYTKHVYKEPSYKTFVLSLSGPYGRLAKKGGVLEQEISKGNVDIFNKNKEYIVGSVSLWLTSGKEKIQTVTPDLLLRLFEKFAKSATLKETEKKPKLILEQ
ncbi:MAG: hypothetical protein QXT45_03690 [Candidatus Bilamarchaeaceae archaeon]